MTSSSLIALIALSFLTLCAADSSRSSAMSLYQLDCGANKAKVPGAGLSPVALGGPVLKDGFAAVSCVKDYMLGNADKSGDGKFAYAADTLPNVSIVNYADVVAKEDRESMSPAVCFQFCRSVPDMQFFGLTQGRYCYCTPYYRQVAGDSSDCDAVCEGEPTSVCGGKTKSSIYAMHACADTSENLVASRQAARAVMKEVEALAEEVSATGAAMQSMADSFQKSFGAAGDPAASDLMQRAKKFAGVVVHGGDAGHKLRQAMKNSLKDTIMEEEETTDNTVMYESYISKLEAVTEQGKAKVESLTELAEKSQPAGNDTKSHEQYYPVMYFVDKKFVDGPSTCSGVATREPLVSTFDGCARACDAAVGSCSAYSYFGSGDTGLCFLFSKLLATTYYTDCPGSSFLQRHQEKLGAGNVQCMAKLQDYVGSSLKPDPSGKCPNCLKEAKKAARCFK
mmetsp:Transcript_7857/g.16988  ORF Transcript_7857/g.16988 Transcript_7857/m.16988 type:complete len:452 (-) Transcript_7857:85-1440(-)